MGWQHVSKVWKLCICVCTWCSCFRKVLSWSLLLDRRHKLHRCCQGMRNRSETEIQPNSVRAMIDQVCLLMTTYRKSYFHQYILYNIDGKALGLVLTLMRWSSVACSWVLLSALGSAGSTADLVVVVLVLAKTLGDRRRVGATVAGIRCGEITCKHTHNESEIKRY